jgi:hypothetical protein
MPAGGSVFVRLIVFRNVMKLLSKIPRPFRFALAGLIIVLVGCESSVIRSTRLNPKTANSGLAYFLPMGWLKFTVRMEAVSNLTTKKLETNVLSVSPDVILAADRTAGYVLQMTPSAAADDYIQLKVTNGLLQSVALTNTDQTLGILSNLPAAVVEALNAAFPGAVRIASTNAPEEYKFLYYVTNIYMVDPFAKETAQSFPLGNSKATVSLGDFWRDERQPDSSCDSLSNGIFYRALEPYHISWDDPETSLHQETVVWLPNKGSRLFLGVDRAFGVRQSASFLLQQGIPYSVTLNKPSEYLAASSFPLTALKELTGLPTNLIQFRINLGGSSSSGSTNAAASTAAPAGQSNSFQVVIGSNLVQIVVQSNSISGQSPVSPGTNGGK